MWKVLLAFIAHRLLLLAIALLTINSKVSPERPGHTFKKLESTSVLMKHFTGRLENTREVEFLDKASGESASAVVHMTADPFLWFARWVRAILPLSSLAVILILSNLFCLFFAWEIYGLVNRMALPEVAVGAATLSLLWMTNYELSLGSSLSLTCLLFTSVLRNAIDNQWFIAGLALCLLGASEPVVLAFLPFLIIIFWYHQRHYQLGQVAKRTVFFAVPLILMVAWKWEMYRGISGYVSDGFLNQVFRQVIAGNIGWLFEGNNAAATVASLFFLAGAIASAMGHTTAIHRLASLYMLVIVLLFSTTNAVGARIQLASVALGGLAVVSSDLVLKLIQLLMVILGGYEVCMAFSQ